jgi:hypothetical protein
MCPFREILNGDFAAHKIHLASDLLYDGISIFKHNLLHLHTAELEAQFHACLIFTTPFQTHFITTLVNVMSVGVTAGLCHGSGG